VSAEWVTAIATVIYTAGTFLLWRVTQRSLNATRELFRLTLLVEFYRAQEPAPNVGHGWETREVPARIEQLRDKQREAMKRAFPELEDLAQ
jgi:hypothetical protein